MNRSRRDQRVTDCGRILDSPGRWMPKKFIFLSCADAMLAVPAISIHKGVPAPHPARRRNFQNFTPAQQFFAILTDKPPRSSRHSDCQQTLAWQTSVLKNLSYG